MNTNEQQTERKRKEVELALQIIRSACDIRYWLPSPTTEEPLGEAQRACNNPKSESPPGVWEMRCHALQDQITTLTQEFDCAKEDRKVLEDQLSMCRKERDEAIRDAETSFKTSQTWQVASVTWESRAVAAEQKSVELLHDRNQAVRLQMDAEKKLAEMEKEKNEALHALQFRIEESSTILGSLDKLNKQLSRFRWIPTSERMPTNEDADESGIVWVWDVHVFGSGPRPIRESHLTNTDLFGTDGFWMTPIKPTLHTPPEEDAFTKLWNSKTRADLKRMGDPDKEVAREFFLAGRQSK